jgi:hypothetical protein
MFQWDKSINAINIPAGKVVHLFRSMREVQLALPGVSAQEASAFLCQYQTDEGVETVAVFHLHKSRILAFYYSDPRVVAEQKIDSMLDQSLNFVESMGFLMTDQDIHLLKDDDQEMLWASLPLKAGLPEEVDVKPVAVEKKEVSVKKKEAPVKKESNKAVKVEVPAIEPEKVVSNEEPEAAPAENVDDLLAAVEAMRAKRPGLRARKMPPSVEEMDHRRLQLCETIGRILASL